VIHAFFENFQNICLGSLYNLAPGSVGLMLIAVQVECLAKIALANRSDVYRYLVLPG